MKFVYRFNFQEKIFFKLIFFIFISDCFLSNFSCAVESEYAKNCSIVPSSIIDIRLHNIDLMRNVLKKGKYTGYDIIIISSTTQKEAEYQQQLLEKVFDGTSKEDGRKPIILSVVDVTDGGQLIGSVYTWLQAERLLREMFPEYLMGYKDLISYIKEKKLKVAVYHNGGRGERCSPLTQSLGNSRGAQKLVGSIVNAQDEEIELGVLLGVVLQCSSCAVSNNGTHVDTFWTSQIAFGSHPHDQLIRSNFGIDKFLVGFDKKNLIAQNIADFGTDALEKNGALNAFYGNKRFASRKGNYYVIDQDKIQNDLFDKGSRFAYDFGSFSTSFGMWELLIDYWKKKQIFDLTVIHGAHTQIKRDIDPHFIQPFIRFLFGINVFADCSIIEQNLPHRFELMTQKDIEQAREIFDKFMIKNMPAAHAYIWEDVNNETDEKKKLEAKTCLNEIIEFYLMYHESAVFKDLKRIFGFIDLGKDTQWFRYRRPIDIMNEKLEMLTDVIGYKIETQLDGTIQFFDGDENLKQRSREARLMRGLNDHEIAHFTVEGKKVSLSKQEIAEGITVEEVFIKNSIVQNSDLTRGSHIENSVVNYVIGKVNAHYSYLESSISPFIEASKSVIHQVIDNKKIEANREVVSDVFKSSLLPAYHGRMRAPIGYDPKGMPIYKVSMKNQDGSEVYSDEYDDIMKDFFSKISYRLNEIKEFSDKTARTEDGLYTFEQIREIKPLGAIDKNFMELLSDVVKKKIREERQFNR